MGSTVDMTYYLQPALLLATLLSAWGTPITDHPSTPMIPDDEDMWTSDSAPHLTSLQVAYKTLTALKATQSSVSPTVVNDIRELLQDADDSVASSMAALQSAADALPRGEQCVSNERERSVTQAKAVLKRTEAKENAAKAAVKAIAATKVDLGAKPLNELVVGQCDWFFNSDRYLSIKTRHVAASKALSNAQAESDKASKAVSDAMEPERVCYCNTRRAHEKLYAEGMDARRVWSLSYKVKCLLDGADVCKKTLNEQWKLYATVIMKPVLSEGARKAECSDIKELEL